MFGAKWISCLAVLAIAPATFGSPKPASNAMNPALKHHVVTFPDCQLHFDYPADLKPSPDFIMQRMESKVAYDKIRWVTPNASVSFVELHADLHGRKVEGVLATLTINMWLCAAPAGFNGDVANPEDLRRANVDLDKADRVEVATLSDVPIQDRTWLFKPSCSLYMAGLNRTIFVVARVSVAGNTPDEAKWRDWAEKAHATIIGSLRIERPFRQDTTTAREP